jgi:hypothetical protein
MKRSLVSIARRRRANDYLCHCRIREPWRLGLSKLSSTCELVAAVNAAVDSGPSHLVFPVSSSYSQLFNIHSLLYPFKYLTSIFHSYQCHHLRRPLSARSLQGRTLSLSQTTILLYYPSHHLLPSEPKNYFLPFMIYVLWSLYFQCRLLALQLVFPFADSAKVSQISCNSFLVYTSHTQILVAQLMLVNTSSVSPSHLNPLYLIS